VSKDLIKRIILIALSGVAIYFVLPSITEVLASWPRLSSLEPTWFVVAVGAEVAHFLCTFTLQRLALRTKGWFPVVTAQLVGNAVTNIMPAGAAAGAAVQFRMLQRSGINADDAAGGMTAFSLLGVGALLTLPVIVLPSILVGSVSPTLAHAAFLGTGAFVLFAALSALVFVTDRPLIVCAAVVQWALSLVLRRPRNPDLAERLLDQRDQIKSVLGHNWRQAVVLSAGRLAFDYLCLLAAVRATGSHARPTLVLVTYAAANIIALVPITPGGLGIVEASMSGLLVLAGVNGGNAFLATLTYRLASYWLPLVAGPVAYFLFRRRYASRPTAAAASRSGPRDLSA
jgi:uncharacterized protein (TIRG00374 family)